jgi:quercetin dioxygenase-like cupin family protein
MHFISLDDLPAKTLIPGFDAQFIHTHNLTIGYVNIKAGSVLPEHAHPHEQITHVLEGALQLTIEGETQVVKPGVVAVIPGHHTHSAVALTDCKALDVFYPVREDYREHSA